MGEGSRRATWFVGAAALAIIVTGVPLAVAWLKVPGTGPSSGATPTPSPSVSASASSTPTAKTPAQAAYDRMTPAQRVGQLFVMGVAADGATDDQLDKLRAGAGGGAFLRGDTDLGVADTRKVTDEIAEATTYAGVEPFVAADQEGGNAQALTGTGFSDMPTALAQGELSRPELRGASRRWARELKQAGVTLNLAPVADVVPSDVGTANEPIGSTRRQFGSTVQVVSEHVTAFVRGFADVQVATAVKHFPGLGRATGNTDSDPSATDPTTRRDPLLAAYRGGLESPMMMVSSARYPAIDDVRRACFSPTVMGSMLRQDLGYDGIIISDSFGSASVAGVPAGQRAVRFLKAGGTVVLDTNIDDLEPMTEAVLAEMRDDDQFAATTKQNVLRVLQAKAKIGLVAAS